MDKFTTVKENSILEELISGHHQAFLLTLEYPESENAEQLLYCLGTLITKVEALGNEVSD